MTTLAAPPTSAAIGILTDLAACLCAEIEASGLPGTCFCGVVPGDIATQDYSGNCKDGRCGMAWVRLVSFYPSDSVGAVNVNVGNCSSGDGADLEMGIMRCMPIGDAAGNPPTPVQLLDVTALQLADADAMRRAIVCCPSLPTKHVILTGYAPIGPSGSGGLVGGIWTMSVGL